MRVPLTILGFLFLAASAGMALVMIDDDSATQTRWTCEPPDSGNRVHCTGASGVHEVQLPIVSGLIGVGLLIAANGVPAGRPGSRSQAGAVGPGAGPGMPHGSPPVGAVPPGPGAPPPPPYR